MILLKNLIYYNVRKKNQIYLLFLQIFLFFSGKVKVGSGEPTFPFGLDHFLGLTLVLLNEFSVYSLQSLIKVMLLDTNDNGDLAGALVYHTDIDSCI